VDGSKARVERLLEEANEVVETPLPAVITVVKQINEPRLPSLKGMMKAKKVEIKALKAEDLEVDLKNIGLNGSPTQVIKIFSPPPKSSGELLNGDPKENVEKLIAKLKERKTI
jgi:electron transfer flavoprotein beta subunit